MSFLPEKMLHLTFDFDKGARVAHRQKPDSSSSFAMTNFDLGINFSRLASQDLFLKSISPRSDADAIDRLANALRFDLTAPSRRDITLKKFGHRTAGDGELWKSTSRVTAMPAKEHEATAWGGRGGQKLANIEGGTLTGHWPRQAAGRTNESSKERVCPRPSTSTFHVYVIYGAYSTPEEHYCRPPFSILPVLLDTDSESVQGRTVGFIRQPEGFK